LANTFTQQVVADVGNRHAVRHRALTMTTLSGAAGCRNYRRALV